MAIKFYEAISDKHRVALSLINHLLSSTLCLTFYAANLHVDRMDWLSLHSARGREHGFSDD